jgi:predicted nucleic acid-binding protein
LSKVFADTSSFLALLSQSDSQHLRARESFEQLKRESALLVSTSYVLVETYALLDRRLGREAVRRFREKLAPLLDVVWVDRDLHEKAMDLLLASPHSVSLVDAASFACMRQMGLDRAWAIDRHFVEQGFEIIE